jgi:GxxExxY protein
MKGSEKRFGPLTDQIIGAVLEVSNSLGAGFLEKAYRRALLVELTSILLNI